MITRQNYEEYMMMLVDGELNSHEEQELMAFMSKHPELKNELAAFNVVKLQPDTEIVFKNKESLMKSVSTKRVIAFPVWQRYSIAAGVAAIIFITLFKFTPQENQIASVVPAPVNATASAVVPVQKATQEQKTNAPIIEDHAPVNARSIAKVENVKSESKGNTVAVTKNRVEAAQPQMIAAAVPEMINTAIPAAPRPIENELSTATSLSNVPALALVGEIETQERRSLFDILSIEEGKKRGIETVTVAVATTLDKAHSIKKDIDDRNLSVRIENKRLILSF